MESESGTERGSYDGLSLVKVYGKLEISTLVEALGSYGGYEVGSSNGR